MGQGSDGAPMNVPEVATRATGDGPVSPTSGAIGRLRPLRLRQVALSSGSTLGQWQGRNTANTLPHCVEQVRQAGALRNLGRAARQRPDGPYEGMLFSDSDVYKVLEAAAWDSIRGTATTVADFVAEATELTERAQREDGYINSWAQAQSGDLAWKDLRWGHELYCAGHLLQATVATQRTGGDGALMRVASRLVDHLVGTFSLQDGDGRLVGVCGHPLVETALVEFYRSTGEQTALRLAARYVELRGRPDVGLPTVGRTGDGRFSLSYFLHHAPVRNRKLATGHAVRELYLQAGVVDVATETGDHELLRASEAIWEDLYATKTYVTGAHGSRHRDESIGDPYELPSDRAYAETCAGIASFQWNWRLLLATGQARYAAEMERVFWNTIAGSVSRQGTEFFYSNSLHLRTEHQSEDEDSPSHRLRWYQCSCCPPNLARLLASIQAYLVTEDGAGLQVHMPFSGTVSAHVPGGSAEMVLRSAHPWDGATDIEVRHCSSAAPWEMSLRLPQWAGKDGARLELNGEPVGPLQEEGYLKLSRPWRSGDRVRLSVPMPVRVLRPHWRVDAVRGSAAVQRGPLVYCVEEEDLPRGSKVEDIALDEAQPLEASDDVPGNLQGYANVAIRGSGVLLEEVPEGLYGAQGTGPTVGRATKLTFIPYFARENRPSAGMRVWVPLAKKEK